ncbi:MAG: hypothetical protein MUF31_17035 [Akkermansiaceae bacterium]|nr:hypothetical protein [Akkermansiaceae bacterium]
MLVLLSAGLGVLAFPPVHWHGLALVYLLPFFLAIRGAKPETAVLLGLVHGLALFCGTLHWLLAVFGPFALLLHFILALFPAIFAGALAGLEKRFAKPWVWPWIVGILWAGIEHFRSEWFTLRFAWITPGTGLPPGALTPLIGVYGISLVIATGCAFLSMGGRQRWAGFTLLLLTLLSCHRPPRLSEPGQLQVAAVQSEEMSANRLFDLSDRIDRADAIIWPEYAIDFDPRHNPEFMARVQELLIAKHAEVLVLGGRVDLEPKRWQNTAFAIGRQGVLGTHVKNRPVHFFDDGEAGTEAPAISSPLGIFSMPICFDNDYAAVQRRAVANGASFLLIPSMDAAHWTATQHLQHGELFRHRAAENGRYLVVAATSGLTQAIDDRGRRIDSLPLFAPGLLETRISPSHHTTVYQRGGWLVGPVCTMIALGLVGAGVILPRIRRRNPSGE